MCTFSHIRTHKSNTSILHITEFAHDTAVAWPNRDVYLSQFILSITRFHLSGYE